jgi:hypothetical protein
MTKRLLLERNEFCNCFWMFLVCNSDSEQKGISICSQNWTVARYAFSSRNESNWEIQAQRQKLLWFIPEWKSKIQDFSCNYLLLLSSLDVKISSQTIILPGITQCFLSERTILLLRIGHANSLLSIHAPSQLAMCLWLTRIQNHSVHYLFKWWSSLDLLSVFYRRQLNILKSKWLTVENLSITWWFILISFRTKTQNPWFFMHYFVSCSGIDVWISPQNFCPFRDSQYFLNGLTIFVLILHLLASALDVNPESPVMMRFPCLISGLIHVIWSISTCASPVWWNWTWPI